VPGVFVIELTPGFGSLWLAEFEQYRLLRVNPATRKVVARIPVIGPTDVKAGAGSIWVLAHRADEILRIEPATNRVEAAIPLISEGSTPERMAFGEGALWVSDPHGQSITRVDPVKNKATVEIPMPGDPYSWPGQVATGGGYVWTIGAQHLFRVDPSTNVVTGAVRLTANPRCDVAREDSENCLQDVQYAFGAVWVTDRVNRKLYRVAIGDD
jgi:streptogramin lyase